MAAGAGGAQDLHRWVACAVALTRLPVVNSEVYYFPQGHAEQWPSLPAPQADQPMFPCTVTSIHYFTAGEEPFARISLLPAIHSNQPAADTRPNPDSFVYFPKSVVQADIQRTYMAVPKLCVDSFFPVLEVGSNTQALHMSDLSGEAYEFEHKVTQKHELRGHWEGFRAAKGLGVGDTVLFIRRSDQSILIEARRRQPVDYHVLQEEPSEELEESSQFAALGVAFTVTYYPGRGSGSPFVVPRGAVDEAMGKQWDAGMVVRMRPRDLVLHARDTHGATFDVSTGTIKTVTPGLVWRNLQLDLDASGSSSPTNKNMWEVEPIQDPPPVAKRTKVSTDPLLPGDDQSKKPVKTTLSLVGADIKAKEDIVT